MMGTASPTCEQKGPTSAALLRRAKRESSRQQHRARRPAALLIVTAIAGFVAGVAEPPPALATPVEEQRDRIDAIVDELERVERESAVLAEDHIDVLAEQAQLETEIARLETQLGEQLSALNELRGQLSQIAVDSFTGSGARSLPFLLASYNTHTTDQQRTVFTGVATDTGNVTTDDLDVALAELDAIGSELDSRLEVAERLVAEIDAARDANQRKQTEYEQARTRAEAELGALLLEEQERRARASYAELVADQQPTASINTSPNNPEQDATRTPATPPERPPTPPTPATEPTPARAPEPPPSADPPPAPEPSKPAPTAPNPSGLAEVAIDAALSQLGVPWIFATAQPGVGFDCSGLTSWAWGKAGVSLPHQSRAQFAALPQVAKSNAQRGDLLFYYSPISHVGIYLGNGQLVHSPNSGDTVKVSSVNWNNVTGVGRPG